MEIVGGTVNVSTPELMKKLTIKVNVKTPGWWSIRFWVARFFLQLFCLIVPAETEVEIKIGQDDKRANNIAQAEAAHAYSKSKDAPGPATSSWDYLGNKNDE